MNISRKKAHPWKMDHEIELIPHCSPVAFKFAEFRGTHLWRELPHDKGGMLAI